MKVVILAGGYGTRLSEETHVKPKPMIEIGGMPILWHIMKIYSHYGYNDFIICLGYKGSYIKEWFNNYYLHHSDVTFDFESNSMVFHNTRSDKWKVTLVDTGEETMTGGRIKRIQPYIGDETFMLTYGDGVSDINLHKLIEFHKKNKKAATVTAVIPEGRFGVVHIDGSHNVTAFNEKKDNKGKISGGFFVLEPEVFDHITEGDGTVFERVTLEKLVAMGSFAAYPHEGFWKAMDTLGDKHRLEDMWKEGRAPWRVWDKRNENLKEVKTSVKTLIKKNGGSKKKNKKRKGAESKKSKKK